MKKEILPKIANNIDKYCHLAVVLKPSTTHSEFDFKVLNTFDGNRLLNLIFSSPTIFYCHF